MNKLGHACLAVLLSATLLFANTTLRNAAIVSSTMSASAISSSTITSSTVQLLSGSTLSGTVGNSGNVQQAGTVGATAQSPFCNDGSGNTTDSGCGFSKVQVASSTSICTTSGSSYASCSTTITWPVAFADTNYKFSCTGFGITNFPYIGGASSKTVSSVTLSIFNGTSNGAMASTYSEIDCIGIHP